jgi:hypothetical protein
MLTQQEATATIGAAVKPHSGLWRMWLRLERSLLIEEMPAEVGGI